jgi:hypothetical protein
MRWISEPATLCLLVLLTVSILGIRPRLLVVLVISCTGLCGMNCHVFDFCLQFSSHKLEYWHFLSRCLDILVNDPSLRRFPPFVKYDNQAS